MFTAHETLMGAQQPPPQQRRNSVYAWHGHMSRVFATRMDSPVVDIALFGQLMVAAPTIRMNLRTRLDEVSYERHEDSS